MALTFVDTEGTLIIPQAAAKWETAPSNAGIATRGVVVLVGEAEAGPDFTGEGDLSAATFGPNQYAQVRAKYSSGNIVDAYRNVANPSKDPGVRGSPTRIICVKTNAGTKATAAIGSYGVLTAKSAGSFGNLIYSSVASSVDGVPPYITAAFARLTATETVNLSVNGLASYTLLVSATDPAAFATANLAGLWSAKMGLTGGVGVSPVTGMVGGTAQLTTDGALTITITVTGATWTNQPLAGQTLLIAAGDLQGAASANLGSYVITSATSSTIVAKKVSEAAGGTPVATVAVASFSVVPATFGATDYSVLTFTNRTGTSRFDTVSYVAASAKWSGTFSVGVLTVAMLTSTNNPLNWYVAPKVGDVVALNKSGGGAEVTSAFYQVATVTASGATLTKLSGAGSLANWSQITILAGDFTYYRPSIPGLGKSITAYRDPASVGAHFFNSSAVAAPMSVSGDFQVSSAESRVTLSVTRKADNISESSNVGGDVVLKLGKAGNTTAPVTYDGIYLKGGVAGADWSILVSQYKTLGDVAAFVSSKTSWTASATTAFRSLPPTVLDQSTFEANSNNLNGTSLPARIKSDAYDVIQAIDVGSGLVSWVTDPIAGLPEVQSATFLSGGARGATSNANVLAALDAAGLVRGNFIVTLFSQDAITDIAAGLTDSGSTYDIASVNAGLDAHISKFSQFKRRKPRQGFASFRGTFSASKSQAQSLGNFRDSCPFQDVSALGANGLQWFQPWMISVLAAGMQAAAFYRPIFNKAVNCSGVRQNVGDFQHENDDQVEEALLAGLLVMRPREDNTIAFVSDQTTYGTDENFVYNSIQAVYTADTIAMTVAQRMERAFVGQSFADVTGAVAMSYFKGIMADLRRLKLVVASSDAVEGYKDLKIEISPPSMAVSCEVKEATGIYFVPIKFTITQTTQTVTA